MRPQTSDFFAGRNVILFFVGVCSVAVFFATLCFAGIGSPVHSAPGDSLPGATPVQAAGGIPRIGLQPAYPIPNDPTSRAYFIFKRNPGASIRNAVLVTNIGAVAGNVTLYGTDATTGMTSGTIYQDQTARQQDVGRWLTLERTSLTLVPGESIIVPFKVTLPQKVRSGVHLGGIGMEVTPIGGASGKLIGDKNKLRVHARILIIIAVEMILPGTPVERLTATGIQAGGANNYQTLQLALHNTGNQLLKPFGMLEVMDAHGAHLQVLPIKMDTFLPATSILYPVYLKQALGEGNYQATLTLTYGNHHSLRYHSPFTITLQQVQQAFPSSSHTLQAPMMGTSLLSLPLWMLLAGGLLGICILLFLIQQRRSRILIVRKKKKK